MSLKLPRYVEARLGERADAFLIDGARTKALSLIEGSAGEVPSIVAAPPESSAEIEAVANTIARVSRAHANVSSLAGASVVEMRGVDEGVLELHRHEIRKRRASAT